MKTLRHLDLSECNVPNVGIAHLAKSNLKWLGHRKCQITSEGIACLGYTSTYRALEQLVVS